MGLRKYTIGNILRSKEEKQEQKVAAKNFTEKDREELRKENCDDGTCNCIARREAGLDD